MSRSAAGSGTGAAATKSPEAFRTISEVADDLGLPQHVLRFWETRFAQIKPLKRGGGRRLYRPDHVALLRGIKAMLYDDGLSIRDAQKALREQGARAVIERGRGRPGLAPDAAHDRLGRLRARLDERGLLGPLLARLAEGAAAAAEPAHGAGPEPLAAHIARLEALLARLEAPAG